MADVFKYGHSNAPQWREAALACLAQIGEVPTSWRSDMMSLPRPLLLVAL